MGFSPLKEVVFSDDGATSDEPNGELTRADEDIFHASAKRATAR